MNLLPFHRITAVGCFVVAVSTHGANFTVTNTNPGGPGSFAQAVTSANSAAGPHTINFNISNSDPNFVDVDSALPGGDPQPDVFVITMTNTPVLSASGGITVNGASQTAFGGDTNPFGPEISLNGNNAVGGVFLVHNNQLIALNIRNCLGGGVTTTSGTNNTLRGNYIGTDPTGRTAQPNTGDGIDFRSAFNIIGGPNPGDGNVISGNALDGIRLRGAQAANNIIQGNFIGTDATGTMAIPAPGDGIECQGANNLIGGTAPGAGNLLSGNASAAGVRLAFAASSNTVVRGNLIGTDITGTVAIPNREGIDVVAGATGVVIGGTNPNEGNVISGNTRAGVRVYGNGGADPIRIAILGNSIYSNATLGIDLVDTNGTSGVTVNDPCDGDPGPGNFQNYPVLTFATNLPTGVRIVGTLDSTANSSFTLEFFANTACDPSGFGEGEAFIGSTNVTTDGSCMASFDVTFPALVNPGSFITATATDPNNNTSEFSECRALDGPEPVLILCSLSPQSDTNFVGQAHSVTATVTSNGVPVSGVTVDFEITAGPDVGTSDSVVTDGNGKAVFAFNNNSTAGLDTIQATGTVSSVALDCTATKLWIIPQPDLKLTKTDSPDPVTVGSDLTYTVLVVNDGTLDATGVTVTDALPASVTFVSASPGCAHIGNSVICDLGALAIAQTATVSIVVSPASFGSITNTATATANEADANQSNNSDTEVTAVAALGDDLTVDLDVAPITITPTPKGPAYDTSGMISLANNGVVYGMADFTLNLVDATKPPKPNKPLKPKWAFSLQITKLTFDLGSNPSSKVNFYLSDDAVFDPVVDAPLLKPGKEPTTAGFDALAQVFTTPKLSFKIPKSVNLSGKYVLVVIDFDNQVIESNNTNNTAAIGPIP